MQPLFLRDKKFINRNMLSTCNYVPVSTESSHRKIWKEKDQVVQVFVFLFTFVVQSYWSDFYVLFKSSPHHTCNLIACHHLKTCRERPFLKSLPKSHRSTENSSGVFPHACHCVKELSNTAEIVLKSHS